MKIIFFAISVMSFSSLASNSGNELSGKFGIGIGAMYSGLGGNASLASDRDMKYISFGCNEYSSSNGSSCGLGLGWIKTDLFNSDSNKHGFGVYVSKVGQERQVSIVNGTFRNDEQDVYGLGLSYTYFNSGIDSAGFNYGLSIHGTNADNENRVSGFFQIGYQF